MKKLRLSTTQGYFLPSLRHGFPNSCTRRTGRDQKWMNCRDYLHTTLAITTLKGSIIRVQNCSEMHSFLHSIRLELLWRKETSEKGSGKASLSMVAWRFCQTRIIVSTILETLSILSGFIGYVSFFSFLLQSLWIKYQSIGRFFACENSSSTQNQEPMIMRRV